MNVSSSSLEDYWHGSDYDARKNKELLYVVLEIMKQVYLEPNL